MLVVKWVVDPELAEPYGGAPTAAGAVVVVVVDAGGLGYTPVLATVAGGGFELTGVPAAGAGCVASGSGPAGPLKWIGACPVSMSGVST